jgi:hypothetical protein
MRFFSVLGAGAAIAAISLCVQGQTPQKSDTQAEAKGIPPRTAPSEYQAQAQAGSVTVAAEFKGHSVPTLDGTLSSEDFVVVEAALFGAAGARLQLSAGDFSLRINGKKQPLPSQPYGLVVATVKDPEWEPPEPKESKSKTSIGGGGKSDHGNEPPAPVQVPVPVRRAMAQKVQKATLPEGDRPLPQAGLLYFQYRGKTNGIRSVELIYAGAAGTATLALQP